MKILFYIAGIPVHFFGVMTAIGILAGFYVVNLLAVRNGQDKNKVFDLAIYTVLVGIIGARVFYILFYNPLYYLQNPLEIIKMHQGGLSIHGSIIAGAVFGYWYVKKHKLNFWRIADTFAPGIILGQAIGRIGCDVFGKPMTSQYFWGVSYAGQLLHPAQIYEAVLNFVAFFILWRKSKTKDYNGQVFLWYIILFAINRGIVEFFRTNPMIFGVLSVSHLLSLGLIAGALTAIWYIKNRPGYEIKKPVLDNGQKTLLSDIAIIGALTVISVFIYYMAWK